MTVRCKFTIIYSPLNLSSYFSFYVTASSLVILLSLPHQVRQWQVGLCGNDGWIDCHTDWILLTQNRGMVKNFVISYSSVIARSEATKQSREGTWYTGLLRYARNDREQMDCFATLAMTDKIDCYDYWRKSLGGDTFIYALFDNKTNCVIIKKTFDKREFSAYAQSINQSIEIIVSFLEFCNKRRCKFV